MRRRRAYQDKTLIDICTADNVTDDEPTPAPRPGDARRKRPAKVQNNITAFPCAHHAILRAIGTRVVAPPRRGVARMSSPAEFRHELSASARYHRKQAVSDAQAARKMSSKPLIAARRSIASRAAIFEVAPRFQPPRLEPRRRT